VKELRSFFISPLGEIKIYRGEPQDGARIRELYMKAYGNKYTLKEVIDPIFKLNLTRRINSVYFFTHLTEIYK